MTAPLFHGPSSREAAVQWAEEHGRLLAEPFGDDGLKVATARELVEILGSTPVGDRVGTVVIGPMDSATPEAADALLKTLEEIPDNVVLPALWAHDVGAIIGTVRSRTDEVWCPPDPEALPEAPFLKTAESLCEAALRRKVASVIETLTENEGNEVELLRASAVVLATKDEWKLSARLKLWESLRDALRDPKPPRRVVLAAYLV